MLTLSKISRKNFKTWSKSKKNNDITTAIAKTINAPWRVSFPVGQDTLKASCFTSWINLNGFFIKFYSKLAGAEGLEPSASGFGDRRSTNWATLLYRAYSIILVTTPAPTVLPPSRIAKFNFSDMAIGVISFTVNLASSPGITISVPAGNSTSPVTSVVLK